MNRRSIHRSWLYPLAAVAGIVCQPEIAGAARAEASDALDSIRVRVEAYELAWNTHDPAAVAEFFAADADMIIGNGPRIDGRREIRDSWGAYFARIDPGRRGRFEIRSIRLIAPDVALLNIDSTTAGRDSAGRELPTRLARGTWVVVRRDGEWLVAALRAQPAVGENRTSPGTDR